MEKIYTISLDGDIPLSDNLLNEIKLLCFLVYDSIKNLEYDNIDPILCNDGVIYNELIDSRVGNQYDYHFTYNDFESGKYEPFMIDNTSFGFTINGDMLTDDKLLEIIGDCKKILRINYNFKVYKYKYDDDKKHKNRLIALKKILLDKNIYNEDNKKDKYKKVLKPLASSLAIILR